MDFTCSQADILAQAVPETVLSQNCLLNKVPRQPFLAGCEEGGGAGNTGILGDDGAESDGEIADVGGGGDLETSPKPKSKTAVNYMRSEEKGNTGLDWQ